MTIGFRSWLSSADTSEPSVPQIHDNPVTMQRDIDRRTHSPAFHAFFKNQQQLETVTKVSSSIALGQPFRVPPRAGDPTYSSSSLPFHWVAPRNSVQKHTGPGSAASKANTESPISRVPNKGAMGIWPACFDIDDGY